MAELVNAAIGAIAAAIVTALFASGARLRATATADAALLDQIGKLDSTAADALLRSISRSLMLATARTIYPPATLSEVLGVVGAIVGLPILASAASGGTTYRVGELIEFAFVLVLAYAVSTVSWRRRAKLRAAELEDHESTRTTDAPESRRQTAVVLGLQALALVASIAVAAVVAAEHAGWPRPVPLWLTIAAIPIVGLATWAPTDVRGPISRARRAPAAELQERMTHN